MDNREWLDDFMALKQINKNDPFTVPEGYFHDLTQHITTRIRLEGLKTDPSAGFTVPENYFEHLGSNIQSRINIEDAVTTENPGFTVPENYFDELGSNIMSRIAVEEAVNLQPEGFTVPENYFDELAGNIQSRIAIEDAVNMEHEGFTVPENYFESLSTRIQNRVVVEQKVQKRGVVRKMFASHTIRYATAACFALILGLTVILKGTVIAPDHNHSYLHEQVSAVPVDEIKSYLELHMDASDTRTLMDASQKSNSSNSDEDLSDYIDTN